jgi:hypothetical protein
MRVGLSQLAFKTALRKELSPLFSTVLVNDKLGFQVTASNITKRYSGQAGSGAPGQA